MPRDDRVEVLERRVRPHRAAAADDRSARIAASFASIARAASVADALECDRGIHATHHGLRRPQTANLAQARITGAVVCPVHDRNRIVEHRREHVLVAAHVQHVERRVLHGFQNRQVVRPPERVVELFGTHAAARPRHRRVKQSRGAALSSAAIAYASIVVRSLRARCAPPRVFERELFDGSLAGRERLHRIVGRRGGIARTTQHPENSQRGKYRVNDVDLGADCSRHVVDELRDARRARRRVRPPDESLASPTASARRR